MNNYKKDQELTRKDGLYNMRIKSFYTRKYDGQKMVKAVRYNPSMGIKMNFDVAIEMLPILYK